MQNSNTERRPKIGITGSFGRGNLGDELFVKTHEHYLGKVADLYLATNLPHPYYLRTFGNNFIDLMDAIVIGGGDLICPYREKLDQDFISKMYLRKPVYMIGIGVENNKPEENERTMRMWREFLNDKNLQSISVRDVASKTWLQKHILKDQPIDVHPDIVMALPLPEVKRPEGRPILGLVTRSIKHPREYKQMAKIAKYLRNQGWHVRHIIFGVGRHGKKEFENSQLLRVKDKETFHSENLDKVCKAVGECSLLLSMKLHATIVGTMYGVPCITLNPSGKIREFMKLVGRQDLEFSANDPKALEFVKSGIPEVPMERVQMLKKQATSVMQKLANTIATNFSHSS